MGVEEGSERRGERKAVEAEWTRNTVEVEWTRNTVGAEWTVGHEYKTRAWIQEEEVQGGAIREVCRSGLIRGQLAGRTGLDAGLDGLGHAGGPVEYRRRLRVDVGVVLYVACLCVVRCVLRVVCCGCILCVYVCATMKGCD